MSDFEKSPLFGAAVLKRSFIIKELQNTPGYKFVYNGTLRKLGVTDSEVDEFIAANKDALNEYINKNQGAQKNYAQTDKL